jgi:ATPase subunit of ABC transporter with duplicated ATPase domains
MSLLTLLDIEKEYRNQIVLKGATLRVSKGERLALIGPNGSGKTTLLRIAVGLEEPDKGTVTRARQSRIGYLSQDLRELSQGDAPFRTAMDYDKVLQMEKKLRELEKQLAETIETDSAEAYNRTMKKYSRTVEEYEAMDGYTIEAKIKSILLGLGLREEALLLPVERLSESTIEMRSLSSALAAFTALCIVAESLLLMPMKKMSQPASSHFVKSSVNWYSFTAADLGSVLFSSAKVNSSVLAWLPSSGKVSSPNMI